MKVRQELMRHPSIQMKMNVNQQRLSIFVRRVLFGSFHDTALSKGAVCLRAYQARGNALRLNWLSVCPPNSLLRLSIT
jgi:hypothetical protein